ncbi:hypothetical protein D3C81_2154730 [compost metagenome]
MACVEEHGDQRDAIGDGGQQADFQAAGHTRALDDRRHPEGQAIKACVESQQDEDEQPDTWAEEDIFQA